MKCINATAIDCQPELKTKFAAHVSTFEDGVTLVLCPAKDRANPEQCAITGTICAFVRGNVYKLLNPPAMEKPLSENNDELASESAPVKTLTDTVDEAETKAIMVALERHNGEREKAADELGISPTTLWRKMTRLQIEYGYATDRDDDGRK